MSEDKLVWWQMALGMGISTMEGMFLWMVKDHPLFVIGLLVAISINYYYTKEQMKRWLKKNE